MRNKLLATALIAAFTITGSAGLCADNPLGTIKKDFKDAGKSVQESVKKDAATVKEDVKKDVDTIKSDAVNTRKAELEKQKKTELDDLDAKIQAKQKEIDTVKASKITETQKTLKTTPLEKELSYLKEKRATTETTYNKRIEALK